MLDISDDYCRQRGIDEDTENIDSRINLNSPGLIELIGQVASLMFIVGAIIVGLNGGGFKLTVKKLGIDVDIRTGGLISPDFSHP